MEGLRPYRDFMFSQMPLMPYVYAGWFHFTGPSLESARLLSAMFGLGAVILIGLASYRRAGLTAGVVGLLVASINLNYVGETLIARTQPLTVFLTACALFVLSKRNPGKPLQQAGLTMLFMTLAFLSRLSILPCLLLLWGYLGWLNRKTLLFFGAMVVINLAVLISSYAFFNADKNMLFGIYTAHQELAQFMPWSWARLAPTIREWMDHELPIVVLFVAAMWIFAADLVKNKTNLWSRVEELLYPTFLLLSYWGSTTIHWMAPQSYATHQSSIFAFIIVFSAVTLAPVFEKNRQENKFGTPALFILLLLVFQMASSGVTLGLNSNGNRGMEGLHQAESSLRQMAKEGDELLSFNPELAVNSGLRVPSGYEMAEFCYFPRMTNERCAKLKTVNVQKLLADIDSGKYRFFCVDDRLFNLMACGNAELAKQLKEKLDQHYQQAGNVPHYGQFDMTLYIFALKNPQKITP